jgi:hypothetical protein
MTGERMAIRAALRALRRRVRAVLGVAAALFFLLLMLFVPVALLIIAVTVGDLRGEDPSRTASLGLFAIPPAMAWAFLVWLLLILFLVFAPMVAALEPVGAGRPGWSSFCPCSTLICACAMKISPTSSGAAGRRDRHPPRSSPALWLVFPRRANRPRHDLDEGSTPSSLSVHRDATIVPSNPSSAPDGP